jgi:hypothetical protein
VYLFSAHSLKSDVREGDVTEEQLAAVRLWKRKVASIAVEEMLHLAQVTNLLTAVGGAPHFRRTNFPLPANAFSFGVELSLERFSQPLIERLVCYEMPEAGILDPQRQRFYDAMRARVAEMPEVAAGKRARAATEPFEIDFKTVGEFYHKIESGFLTIPENRHRSGR